VKREGRLSNDDFMPTDSRDANNNVFGSNNDQRVQNHNAFNTQSKNLTHFSSAPVHYNNDQFNQQNTSTPNNPTSQPFPKAGLNDQMKKMELNIKRSDSSNYYLGSEAINAKEAYNYFQNQDTDSDSDSDTDSESGDSLDYASQQAYYDQYQYGDYTEQEQKFGWIGRERVLNLRKFKIFIETNV